MVGLCKTNQSDCCHWISVRTQNLLLVPMLASSTHLFWNTFSYLTICIIYIYIILFNISMKRRSRFKSSAISLHFKEEKRVQLHGMWIGLLESAALSTARNIFSVYSKWLKWGLEFSVSLVLPQTAQPPCCNLIPYLNILPWMTAGKGAL